MKLEEIKEDKNREDFHKVAASLLFGVHISEVTPAMRKVGKIVNFVIAYEVPFDKFQEALEKNLTKEEMEGLRYINGNSLGEVFRNVRSVIWYNNKPYTREMNFEGTKTGRMDSSKPNYSNGPQSL